VAKNMGPVDQITRGVVAVVLVIAAVVAGFGTVGGVIALVLAGVLLATATTSFCPLYRALHLNTRRRA